MTLDLLVFLVFALLAVGGGLAAVTLRTAVHSAIALMASLLGVAGLFLHLQAEFLFATQVIAYIGGILLLILVVVMLVNLDAMGVYRRFYRSWMAGAAGAFALFLLLARLAITGQVPLVGSAAFSPDGNTEQLADLMLSTYLLPFELVSLVLLVALAGSVLLARPPKEESE